MNLNTQQHQPQQHQFENSKSKSGSDAEINSTLQQFKSWTKEQVGEWLVSNGFQEYKDFFVKHDITGEILMDLTYNTLGDIGVVSVIERARILQLIKKSFAPATPKLPKSGVYKPGNPLGHPVGVRSQSGSSLNAPSPTNSSSFFPVSNNTISPAGSNASTPPAFRKIQNISATSGDLKSSIRAEREAAALSQKASLSANMHSALRQNVTAGAKEKDTSFSSSKPVKIHPRSASIKKGTSGPSTPQEELFQAVDSIFGGTLQPVTPSINTILPPSSTSNTSLNNATSAEPNSPKSAGSARSNGGFLGEKDIMSMKGVREKFIRVHGIESKQSHIVKISECANAQDVYEKVRIKFNMKPEENFTICVSVKSKVVPLNETELMILCTTDNKYRGNMLLRNVNITGKGSRQKVSKFFGSEVATQSLSKSDDKKALSLFGPEQDNAKAKINKFFGERPPDEIIVNQLEQFFPGIIHSTDVTSNEGAAKELKSIVMTNLVNKRISRRASSIMLRRQTRISMNMTQDVKMAKEKMASISISSSMETSAIMKAAQMEATPKSAGAPISATSTFMHESIPYEPITPELAQSAITPVSAKSEAVVDNTPRPISFRWVPGRMIGQGAFGKVFHALNLDTGEFMAVKQVITGQDNSQQKKSTDSLLREIELLSELDHDNIVRYFGFQEGDDNTFNVFLEYVAGGSIPSVLSKCGKLDEQIARSLTAQILCGVEYLHSRDIIHRDIKGANILVTGDGIVKISDFGISKKNEYTAYHRMTRMSMQGSINWMAPEVARGKGYSAKVDIWSCGCLVLEMLTGQVPWHNVRGNVIYLLGTGNTPPLPPSLSEMAKHFLETTFTIDPEMRPTATTLLEHTFTDIDITLIDFEKWSTEAMQLRAEQGTSSEEQTTDESHSDSDSDEDSEDEEDQWNSEAESPSGIITPTGKPEEKVYSPTSLLHNLEADLLDDDLYDFNSTGYNEIAESLEYLLEKSTS